MTKIIQLQNVSKEELYSHIENIIDRKLSNLNSIDKYLKLSIKEVADELDVSELTVHNYIKKGFIPASRIGRRIFINRVDLDKALLEVKSLKYKR